MPVEPIDYMSEAEYQQALAQEEAQGQYEQEQMWAAQQAAEQDAQAQAEYEQNAQAEAEAQFYYEQQN
jgi:hypothetical protein